MIFLTADTHFNHANIIKYCNRPFSSVEEMNETIIKNWNKHVSHSDMVIFLGDLCFKDSVDTWLLKLNGNKVMIKGNHDYFGKMDDRLDYQGEMFLLTHRVVNKDLRNIWNIHGHSHDKGKLINAENRSICVSTELTNYTPIAITDLLYLRDLRK